MSKFKVGDPVVPVSKSVGLALENSNTWRWAKEKHQPYLFVIAVSGINFKCSDCSLDTAGDFFLESDLIPFEEVQARIEPAEKTPTYYTLPNPVEEKREPDYKGFYEFMMDDKNWKLSCNSCVVKDSGFCTNDTSCFTATKAYAENKFIKRG